MLTNGNTGDDLRPRGDVRRRRPGEPEETHGKEDSSESHGNKPFLWYQTFVFQCLLEASFSEKRDHQATTDDTDENAEERQGAHAEIPSSLLLEGDGEDLEEAVDDTCEHRKLVSGKIVPIARVPTNIP